MVSFKSKTCAPTLCLHLIIGLGEGIVTGYKQLNNGERLKVFTEEFVNQLHIWVNQLRHLSPRWNKCRRKYTDSRISSWTRASTSFAALSAACLRSATQSVELEIEMESRCAKIGRMKE